jgi:S-DNA-T family DNA segregation ATPase FtsK/SpoIIIE
MAGQRKNAVSTKAVETDKNRKTSTKTKTKTDKKQVGTDKSVGKQAESAIPVDESKKNGMRREIKMLIMLGTAVLLFVFLLWGSGDDAGLIGKALSMLLLGLIGIGAWILPVMLIAGAVYVIGEKNDAIFKIRAIFSAVLFVALLAFIHGLGGADRYDGLKFFPFLAYAFTHGASSNGGLFGALLYMGLYKLVGNVGTYIILVLVMVMMLMLISGGSLVGFVRGVANYADDMREQYMDYYYTDDDYDDYDEEEDYTVSQPVRKQARVARRNALSEQTPAPEQPRPIVAFDMKREADKGKKISVITDELKSEEKAKAEAEAPDSQSARYDGGFILPTINGGKGSSKVSNETEVLYNDYTGLADTVDTDSNTFIDIDTGEIFDGKAPTDIYIEETQLAIHINTEEETQPAVHINTEEETQPAVHINMEETDFTPTAPAVEDVPPVEDTEADDVPWYTEEEEPTINAAEETKLVDKLEVDTKRTEYRFPKLEFLGVNSNPSAEKNKEEILHKARKLEETLAIFKVEAKVIDISIGPTVTRYELAPSVGTKVSAVTNLENDIKFSMAAESIIIEAPIPGKSAIGIEIPNDTRESVYYSEVLRSEQFQKFKSKIAFGLGKDITGEVTVADLAKMPHLLVAGTTGSGKSVCINTIIMSILYKATPDEVKMIMVDPKMVELSVYNGIPHLLLPVVTEPEKAAGALNWAVVEMERRYKLLAKSGTRNIEGYNQKVAPEEKLSQIVIIIDELADLMMVVGKEIETSICRLAQKARAAGMHLVLATQRPSADVLTGLIRSNVPSRIAFKVSGSMDSRIILDATGAEKLLGKGDMLFKTADMSKPMRIQGAFITDDEVERVVSYISPETPQYDEGIINEINKASTSVGGGGGEDGEEDALTDEVLGWIVSNPKCASAGKVQRHFKIGFNRASRIIEDLENRGILGPARGSQPREVLMDKYELRERRERIDSYEDY